MVDSFCQPQSDITQAIFSAAAQPPASQNPLDVLLTYQDAVLAYDKAGKTGLGLWNIFRSKGVLNCTYQNFNRALGRFRERFGLPAPYSRRRLRLDVAASNASNFRPAFRETAPAMPQQVPLLPPEPPRRRSMAPQMVPVSPRVASALHAVSVQKMRDAAL